MGLSNILPTTKDAPIIFVGVWRTRRGMISENKFLAATSADLHNTEPFFIRYIM